MSSRLVSLLATAALAVVLLSGRSFAGTSEQARSMAPGHAAVSPVEVGNDSDADRGTGESCEKMHREMMTGGMGDDMRRMHDEMMGEMDRSHPGN
ncbi:MAG: hypothetical protein M3357_01660 [Actinomycetota bacterium]|nr:hypothetical protein [Actinomycetota bacterium]